VLMRFVRKQMLSVIFEDGKNAELSLPNEATDFPSSGEMNLKPSDLNKNQ